MGNPGWGSISGLKVHIKECHTFKSSSLGGIMNKIKIDPKYFNVKWVFLLFFGLNTASALATSVNFVGNVSYTENGSTAVLSANEVSNTTSGGHSGTLRLELWAFQNPYYSGESGYRTAVFSFDSFSNLTDGELPGNEYLSNITSGSVTFTGPPNGIWYMVMMLTEYTGNAENDGYSVDDYVAFSNTLDIGVTGGSSIINDAVSIGGGWYSSPTFGVYYAGGYGWSIPGWIYHSQLGILYVDPSSTSSNMFIYDWSMQSWLWTSMSIYPTVYRWSDGSWLYL